MKVKVDFDLCESNALCVAMAPDVFELDDDDFLVILTEDIVEENKDRAQRAAAACPKSAISIVED